MIQIDAPIKIIFPDGHIETVIGNYAGKIQVILPPAMILEGEELENFKNEFSKNVYVKEAFRMLKEKGYVDTMGMKEAYGIALLSNEFFPPTIAGGYSGVVIVWPMERTWERVSYILLATDGEISTGFGVSGIPEFYPDSVTFKLEYWVRLPNNLGGPLGQGGGEASIMILKKLWCLRYYGYCIVSCYLGCGDPHAPGYWECVRDCINPCYIVATIECVYELVKGCGKEE